MHACDWRHLTVNVYKINQKLKKNIFDYKTD